MRTRATLACALILTVSGCGGGAGGSQASDGDPAVDSDSGGDAAGRDDGVDFTARPSQLTVNPCTLVTQAEAEAVIGPVNEADGDTYDPPRCIYVSSESTGGQLVVSLPAPDFCSLLFLALDQDMFGGVQVRADDVGDGGMLVTGNVQFVVDGGCVEIDGNVDLDTNVDDDCGGAGGVSAFVAERFWPGADETAARGRHRAAPRRLRGTGRRGCARRFLGGTFVIDDEAYRVASTAPRKPFGRSTSSPDSASTGCCHYRRARTIDPDGSNHQLRGGDMTIPDRSTDARPGTAAAGGFRRRRRHTRTIAIAAVMLVLGACGSGSPETSAVTAGPTSSPAPDITGTTTEAADAPEGDPGDPCRVLTAAEAEAFLGEPVGPPTAQDLSDPQLGNGFSCRYTSSNSNSVEVVLLGDRVPRDEWEQAEREQPDLQEVPGVGELAFYDESNNVLDVFDQGRWVQARIDTVNPGSADLIAILSELARLAIERI